MYIVQAKTNVRGWFASANIRGQYPTFAEAEAAIISFGMATVQYRILQVMAEVVYVEPTNGGWQLQKVSPDV